MSRSSQLVRALVFILSFQLISPWGLSSSASIQAEDKIDDEVLVRSEDEIATVPTNKSTEDDTTEDWNPAKVDIGATGAAEFSLPIFTPPARGGIGPEISLTYSSQAYNGWVGFGWMLDMGHVERSTRFNIPSWRDEEDDFEFVFKKSHGFLVWDESNNVYRDRLGGNTKFEHFYSPCNCWKATDSSGVEYYFGSSESSQIQNTGGDVYRWALDRVVDPSGNTMIIKYQKDEGYLYPSRIQYTGVDLNGDGDFDDTVNGVKEEAPLNEIQFVLQDRGNYIGDGGSGAGYRITQRLDYILVTHNGSGVRRYDLTYGSVAYVPDFLTSFVEQVPDGTSSWVDARAPYQFDYWENNNTSIPAGRSGKYRIKKLMNPFGGSTYFYYRQRSDFPDDDEITHEIESCTDQQMDHQNPYIVTATRSFDWDPEDIKNISNKERTSYGQRYFYEDCYHDSSDDDTEDDWREFRGFKVVTSYPADTTSWDVLPDAAITEREFLLGRDDEGENADYYKGQVKRVTVRRASDNVVLYEEKYEYDLQDVADGIQRPIRTSELVIIHEYIGESTTSSSRARKKEMEYDEWGNLTKVIDYGEVDPETGEDRDQGDTRVVRTDYINDSDPWRIGFPMENWIQDAIDDDSANKYRITRTYYDNLGYGSIGNRGLPTSTEMKLDGVFKKISMSTYDRYGNIREQFDANALERDVSIIDPDNGSCSDSSATSCTDYDDTYHQFPVSVRNALGHVVTTEFDTSIGKPLKVTAPTGEVTQYQYDDLGRLIKVAKPGDTLTYPSRCIFYVDYDDGDDAKQQGVRVYEKNGNDVQFTCDSEPSSAKWTIKRIDGMGRTTETLTRGVRPGGSSENIRVSQSFNKRGLNDFVTNPHWEETDGINVSNCSPGNGYCVSKDYDALARVVQIRDAAGNSVETDFQPWITVKEDANYKGGESYYHIKYEEQDAFGNTVFVKEGCARKNCGIEYPYPEDQEDLYPEDQEDLNGDGDEEYVLTTQYTYDPLDNLLTVVDALGNEVIRNVYDEWGRKVRMVDIDAGGSSGLYYEYGYDLNGNLVWQVDPKGEKIKYEYDALNRVVEKIYVFQQGMAFDKPEVDGPDKPLVGEPVKPIDVPWGQSCTPISQDVFITYTYDTYDSEGQDYCSGYTRYAVGQLTQVEDQSGETYYCYDERGRTVKQVKRVRDIDREFVMKWTYYDNDAVKTIEYPDGYTVKYTYNDAGQLDSVKGSDGEWFVKSYEYNPAGQIELIELGNGLYTDYQYYEDGSLRLEAIVTCSGSYFTSLTSSCLQGDIQSLHYQYDPVGNIMSIVDEVENETQRFTYDDLYRLTCGDLYPEAQSSPGSCNSDSDSGLVYSRYYSYDAIGNMRAKGDHIENFDWVYNYTGANGEGPHAVSSIDATDSQDGQRTFEFSYDSNGNMTSIPYIDPDDVTVSKVRTPSWDYENRMTSITVGPYGSSSEPEVELSFTYDEGGARVVKQNKGTGEFTVYIGKLFEVGYEEGDSGPNIFDTKYIFAGDRRIAHIKKDYGADAGEDHWVQGPLSSGLIRFPGGVGISIDPEVGVIALALLLLLLPYGIVRWGFRHWVPVAARLKEGAVVAALLLVVSGGLLFGLGGVKFHSSLSRSPSILLDDDNEGLDHIGQVRVPSVEIGADGQVRTYLP